MRDGENQMLRAAALGGKSIGAFAADGRNVRLSNPRQRRLPVVTPVF